MAATPSQAPLSAAAAALEFLQALGKDPARTYFRTLHRGTAPNASRHGRDLKGFDLAALSSDNASQSIYVVIGNAIGATGINTRTGKPTGCVTDDDCPTCPALFVEWDDKPLDWQVEAWRALGLPEPSLMVATGGKSIHCYWILSEPMPAAEWQKLQRRLLAHCQADTSISNPGRIMRLPGFAYIDKATGKPIGDRAEVIHTSPARYSSQDLEQRIPALPAAPAPLLQAPQPPPSARGAQVPFRDFLCKEVATLLDTGSREGSCNEDGLRLSMELVAVEAWLAQQGAHADETARDAYACYLSHCPDTIGGAPFDTRAALARFDGAADQHPTPATPEEKLLKRLEFHRREASRPASNVLPFSSARSARAGEEFHDESAAAATSARGGAQELGAPIDRWEAAIRAALDPGHPNHERNSIRRQINAATLAGELGLRVSPAQARQRILQIQRAMISGDAAKGTAGGEKARIVQKEWLVDGLIARGCLTGIAAFNKVGKTKMAARLAADLIFGRPFLGRFPVAPGGHRIVLWWVDQPAADSAAYLRAVGLMEPDGTLHPQIVRLYTEEDDLAWDDAGADLLLEHAAEEPGLVLITDSFFHSIQRIYGSDQEPEAGGALIDVQTLLAPYGVTHVCLFHSPKDTGPIGIQAIRGHGSAGGAVSACISLHFMEKRCPMKKVWIADKENPHRRMVVEGRAPFQDLLIRGDFEQGTFEVVGEYQRAVAELLADERQAEAVEGLTEEQLRVLEALGGIDQPKGATVQQIASAVHGIDSTTRSQKELIRKQCKAMVRRGLLKESDSGGLSLFAIRPSALTG